jgi:hypothetical protein
MPILSSCSTRFAYTADADPCRDGAPRHTISWDVPAFIETFKSRVFWTIATSRSIKRSAEYLDGNRTNLQDNWFPLSYVPTGRRMRVEVGLESSQPPISIFNLAVPPNEGGSG